MGGMTILIMFYQPIIQGIPVLWNNDISHALVLLKEPRAIHILIHDTTNAQNTVVSRIYAPAQLHDKN